MSTLCLGSELKLDTYETQFNEGLMAKKHQELDSAFYTSDFPPAKYFYQGEFMPYQMNTESHTYRHV